MRRCWAETSSRGSAARVLPPLPGAVGSLPRAGAPLCHRLDAADRALAKSGPRVATGESDSSWNLRFGFLLGFRTPTISTCDLGRSGQARTAPRRSQAFDPGAGPDLASSGAKSRAPFLQYDSDSNKVKPLGFLGKEVNDTKVWTEFSQTLAEAGKELKMVLPVTKLDKKETRAGHLHPSSGPPPPGTSAQVPLLVKDPGYDAYYDKNGENHKDDLGYVVAGWGRGLHCSGDCGRWYCKEGWPTGPKRPGSTAPTSQGQFQPYFLPRPGPLFSQRHCPNSRHYYFIQVTLVLARRAGKKPGGDSED
ncbi:hypothetical protein ABFV05_007568 [Capra hircus]